ncbi:sporulation membrane protein YtaF [Paenibacillus sediminis]|uniref:Sporulation protein YtaF n=1 Tax=Paenibacillus sediminis TaxID=664909 RepID=A0ABS4H5J2_9BACL|nr:putative sporulation protein YtaF [Paenibacillus sediminis]
MLPHIISLVALAFALSLDSFGVGITYGLRKMKIPLISILIISACSGLIIYASMQLGVLLSNVISERAASSVGAVILIGMGCWSLFQLLTQREVSLEHPQTMDTEFSTSNDKTVFSLEIRKLGLVIQILRTPSAADVDRSGTISTVEAMWLGMALSLDAFGAGLGVALLGFQPLWTALTIALFSGMFIVLGMKMGFRVAKETWIRRFTALPSLLLILIGIIKLL